MSAENTKFPQSPFSVRPVSAQLDEADYSVQLARLGAIVESSDDAILSKTLQGRILSWNAGAQRIFGYTAAEVIGQHITMLIPPELFGEEEQIIEKLKRGERIDHFETKRVRKDGRRIELSITVSPIRDASGVVVGASKVARDISDQKSIERIRAQLAAIVESSDDAILSKTLDGRIQSWNAGAIRIFGYTAEEAIGQPITLIIPPDLYDEERHIIEQVRRGHRIEHFDTTRLSKDGRRIPISVTVSPVLDSRGVIIGASKVARDISERVLAQMQLRDKEALLLAEAAALTKLNDWSSRLWRCEGLDEGLNEMLDAVIELLGADKGVVQLLDPERDVIALAVQRGFSEDFLKSVREIPLHSAHVAANVLRENDRIIVEDFEKDSRYEHLRMLARESGCRAAISTPIISGDGTVLGVVSTCFIAVHQPVAQDLHRLDLYLRLAGDFIQRGKMEQTLLKSEENLRDADRRKDEFLATLAHELRNPLAPIRQAAIIGKSPAVTASQLLWSQNVIERQVQHMALLLEDLLDISRISRGRLDLRKEIVDLRKIIESSVETARPLIDGKHHTLTVDLPQQQMKLSADPLRLAQVIGNLLNNAAKYTAAHGHIHLSVALTPAEIQITVRDDGVGLSSESMKEIFQMFSQVKSSLDQADGGLGIGLSLAKGLVELHGGRIDVASEGRGRGAVFTVHLPNAITHFDNSHADEQSVLATFPRSKILIADDNVDAAESLALLLQMDGHEVQTVFNGEDALATAKEFHPSIAVLDIGMPKLSGYAVAKALRSEAWAQQMILIAVTGWGQAEDKNKSFAAGFDFHLTKPVDPEKLKALLMEATSRSRSQ